MSPLDELANLAGRMAAKAREIVRARGRDIGLRYKPDGSPVTDVDMAVEEAWRAMLEAEAPDHGILGEEYGETGLDREYVWVLDPIDGTRQFAGGLLNFGCLIALCHDGRPVVGVVEQPLAGLRWTGVDGRSTALNGAPVSTRPCGPVGQAVASLCDPDCLTDATRAGYAAVRGATSWNLYDGGCIGMAQMASGRIDLAVYGPNVDPFDICPLVPVVEGAGGCITTWSGAAVTLETEGAIFASGSQDLHREVLGLLGG